MSAAPARIWTLDTVRIRCDEVGDCWIWKQGVNSTGYPQASIQSKTGVNVRTFVYDVLMARKRAKGSNIVARCDNRLCCSPLCLVPRSRSAIVSRQWSDGKRHGSMSTERRRAQAVAQGLAKLTPELVAAIRAMPLPIDRGQVARDHGVARTTIDNVVNGKSWTTRVRPGSSVFAFAEAA